jgi:hypothetical protein
MSATPRSGLTANALTLAEEDLGLMAGKLRAHKAIKVVPMEEKATVNNVLAMVEEVDEWRRMIIYVESPKRAANCAMNWKASTTRHC